MSLLCWCMNGLTYRPDQQTSFRAVVSCAVTDPKHRGDVITTPPTRQTTLEMKWSQRNISVESGEGRNPASRMSASPSTSGRTGNPTSTLAAELNTRFACYFEPVKYKCNVLRSPRAGYNTCNNIEFCTRCNFCLFDFLVPYKMALQ